MTPSNIVDVVPIVTEISPDPPEFSLEIRYEAAREVARAFADLEWSTRRLFLAVMGLSGYSLLCLIYVFQHIRELREQVSKESAQQATLDLADRTCHELGNIAFVLANERRNLRDHIDLVDRFSAEYPEALAEASRRAGLDDAHAGKLRRGLQRELGARGLDPEVEIRQATDLARQVCDQISVCSEYIALTVRELDSYLKRTSLPVHLEALPAQACLADAMAILRPRLEASRVETILPEREGLETRLIADRRLLVHALVNLLKNAAEAMSGGTDEPTITVSAGRRGPSAWIEVSDNGPGIEPDSVSKLFDFGFSTKGAGRGRGLAIALESVRAQGGELRIVPRPPRSGACFRIVLNAASTPAPAVAEA